MEVHHKYIQNVLESYNHKCGYNENVEVRPVTDILIYNLYHLKSTNL